MTREVLSSWVTLPVYRDTIILNHLGRGEEGGRRGSEGGGERETGSQKQRGEGEGMWRGLTNKTCLNLGCLQPEMSVPWGERKR